MLHSLVRVSRRVGWDRPGASDLSALCDCTATPPSRSAGTARSPHRSDAVAAAVRLALLGRGPPLSSVSAASRPGGQHRDPKDSANCPAGRTARRKLSLTGPRGSAVKSDERSHRRRVPGGSLRQRALIDPPVPTEDRAGLIRFPPNGFTHYLTLFPKCFSSFPHGTCSLSVLCQYLALDGVYHPLWAAIPNNPTLRRGLASRSRSLPRTGLSPSLARLSSATSGGPPRGWPFSRLQFADASIGDYRLGLFPLHSPLLGESWLVSFPPLINMLKFSGSSRLT